MRRAALTASLYGRSVAAARSRPRTLRAERGDAARAIFVVGSPRSGTTFLGRSLGAQPGVVDLGEVHPVKARVPELVSLDEEAAARRLRRTIELVRTLALVRGWRPVEQTPEVAFVLAAALRAFPEATAVHMLRDGRDVVCSLLERGWLRARRAGADDARQAYGAHARFWVEEDRREEFESASDATRAAWAWRRYVTAARAVPERTVELRYERLVADPDGSTNLLAKGLGLAPAPLRASLAAAHADSVGRWRRDLSRDELADVEREAGGLLSELGYDG